eukprot:CAMPEP_0115108574 /NCGR_PEP_ID=MMETSP0227-20121206/38089_1 /TAXON_ID=89957 /ORGANISM="Polarella glacialis, Strain CCMP 1383" /LENGTH=45 /DNA_ID= /DNA_START= /DNA_END= /DNA_ORIENTATION=
MSELQLQPQTPPTELQSAPNSASVTSLKACIFSKASGLQITQAKA